MRRRDHQLILPWTVKAGTPSRRTLEKLAAKARADAPVYAGEQAARAMVERANEETAGNVEAVAMPLSVAASAPALIERLETLREMLGWIAEHCSATDMVIYEAAAREFSTLEPFLREIREAA